MDITAGFRSNSFSLGDEVGIFWLANNPSSGGGEDAPIGSVILQKPGSGKGVAWLKRDSSNTDWDALAEREPAPNDTGISVWNDTSKRYETDTNLKWSTGLLLNSYMELDEIAAPGAPGANKGRLYMKAADDGLFWHPNGGSEVDLTVGAGGALRLDEIDNPTGDVAFSMATHQLKFSFTSPAPSDGAFEIEANAGFSGDLVHIHQHSGNPSSVDLVHLEADDVDVLPLRISSMGNSKANKDMSVITNTFSNADNDGTETSILFRQHDSTDVARESGRITIGTEVDWTDTGTTQDSYMAFHTALNGTVAEKMRINSDGKVGIGRVSTIDKLEVDGTIQSYNDGNATFFAYNVSTEQYSSANLILQNTQVATVQQMFFKYEKESDGAVTGNSSFIMRGLNDGELINYLAISEGNNHLIFNGSKSGGASYGDMVLANGSFGIGEASPSQALDLIGAFEMQDTTTATTGVIYKGSDRFLHNFHHPTGAGTMPTGVNTVCGVNAGNFTMGSTCAGGRVWEGSYNSIYGAGAGALLTTGHLDTLMGTNAGAAGTTMLSCTYLGALCGEDTTIGALNTGAGHGALGKNTTGSSDVAVGHFAGRYHANGTTFLTTAVNSVYIGAQARGKDNSDNNSIVVGYLAIGQGANTAVWGNTNITDHYFTGGIHASLKSGATQGAAGAAAGEMWHDTDDNIVKMGV